MRVVYIVSHIPSLISVQECVWHFKKL